MLGALTSSLSLPSLTIHGSNLQVDPKTGEYVGEIKSGPLLSLSVDQPSPLRQFSPDKKEPTPSPPPSPPKAERAAVQASGGHQTLTVKEEVGSQFVSVEQEMEAAKKLSQQGQHAEAIKHFSVAIPHCPPGQILTSLLLGRGKCHLEERMYSEGVEDLERALGMDPSR